MNLPWNGRVVIIDDKIDEGFPLLKVLSKNNIPTTYFTGTNHEELPDKPLLDVRVIFLDIVLGTEGQSDKTKISTAIAVLRKIVGSKTVPYILIAWTQHEEYIDKIKEALKENPPILALNLEKIKCKDDKNNYDLKKIEDKLKKEFEKAGVFQLFLLWENIIHESAGQLINEFTSFYEYNNNWNKNLANVFFQLARAYSGEQLERGVKDEIIKNGLLTFNGTFIDSLEGKTRQSDTSDINIEFNTRTTVPEKIQAKINSKLLLFEFPEEDFVQPGNVYILPDNSYGLNIEELFQGKIDKCNQKEEFMGQLKYILLEVSPLCDFAQNKWRMSRLLTGVLWPVNQSKKIKKSDYIYSSPIFQVNNAIFKLVFDFRCFTSLPFNKLKDKKPGFKIRHELLVDIQSHLARHINRPGVTAIVQRN